MYSVVRPEELIEAARNWVKKRRWYPRGAGDFEVLSFWPASQEVYAYLLKAGNVLIHVPLAFTHERPALPPEDYVKYRSFYVYEAELNPDYCRGLMRGDIDYIDAEFLSSIREAELLEVRPLASGTTNKLVRITTDIGEFVLKSYRTLSPGNYEPLFYKRLGGRLSPRLHATFKVTDLYSSILIDYVDVVEDAGAKLYRSALKTLNTGTLYIPTRHASRIADFMVSLHREIVSCREDWCRPETITSRDIDAWRKKVASYFDELRSRVESYSGETGKILRSLLSVVEERVGEAVEALEEYEGLVKIRAHGDLHVGQIAVTNDGALTILDLEGEPARPDRGVKEPALRDLACALRSLTYISVEALRSHKGFTVVEVTNIILSGSPEAELIVKWSKAVGEALLREYLRGTTTFSKSIHGVAASILPHWVGRALLPWLTERALYEAVYEYSYRRSRVLIPLIGLARHMGEFDR